MAGREPLALQVVALAERITTLSARLDGVDQAVGAAAAGLDQVADLPAVVRDLDTRVRDLADRLDQVAAASASTGPATAGSGDQEDDADSSGLWDWTTMGPDEAADAWHTLAGWVAHVLGGWYDLVGDDRRFRSGVRYRVPPCWYLHPDVLLELSWLCQEWRRLYADPAATAARLGDWHDRYLPGALRRIRTTSSAAGCVLRHGDSDGDPVSIASYEDPRVAQMPSLDQVVRADLDRRAQTAVS